MNNPNDSICSTANYCKELLLSFSIRRNWNTIIDKSVGEDTIPTIHGLRSISMGWVILGHTCIVAFKYSGEPPRRVKRVRALRFGDVRLLFECFLTFSTIRATLKTYWNETRQFQIIPLTDLWWRKSSSSKPSTMAPSPSIHSSSSGKFFDVHSDSELQMVSLAWK